MSAMESLLTVLVPLAMLATLVVLGFGVVQMIRGGNPRRSNKLMQYRVLFQGIALLLFAVLMMVLALMRSFQIARTLLPAPHAAA